MTGVKNFPQKKKRLWIPIVLGCGLVFFVLILLVGIFLWAGWRGYQEAPKLIEVQERRGQFEDPYSLRQDQQDILFSYGYPEAFTILFYDEETLSGGMETVRLETWEYYSKAVGMTFINGELIEENPIEVKDPGTLETLPYYPEQFSAFMSLEEVVSAAGLDTYAEIPLEKEFLQDGVLYYGEALTFGLKNDRLVYIEALALIAE